MIIIKHLNNESQNQYKKDKVECDLISGAPFTLDLTDGLISNSIFQRCQVGSKYDQIGPKWNKPGTF